MQMLILGNGFDLACGLPTSYNDFFTWRINKIKKVWQDIESLLDSYVEEFNKPAKMSYTNLNSDLLETKCFNKGERIDSARTIYDNLKIIMGKMREKEINFFDVYFILNKKNKANWNDIESEIDTIVKNIDKYNGSQSESELRNLIPGGNAYRNNNYIVTQEIYDLFLLMFVEECKENSIRNKYEVLLEELKKFEKEFQTYISEINLKILENPTFKGIYIENCKKLVEFVSSSYIINFNYTNVTEFAENRNHSPKELNVHGRYDEVTIFGIDQGICEVKTDEFIFSKTYRKIAEQTKSIMLPTKKEPIRQRQELVFYGHSLSEADYSYFQSLFDLYDIYNQTFLTFKYSIYDEGKSYEIERDVLHNVTKLLRDYGSTMSNKDHGKNLLHKILLEGRLKVEVVELNKIPYK